MTSKVMVLICILSFLLLSKSVFALNLTNITLDQQNDVCDVLNLSFVDCYDFWGLVKNFTCVCESCEICNFSNYTLKKDCFNKSDCNCSKDLDELEKIDEYKKRGFEPVFEGGYITNFKKADNLSCKTDCSQECFSQIQQIKSQYEDNSPSPKNQDMMFFWFFIGLVIIGGVFFIFKKFSRKFRTFKEPSKDDLSPFNYEHPKPSLAPPPPKPKIQKRGEEDAF